ncbi:hypothetical protein N0V90_004671 [Kalmusia sp. IMI 367209]|nr:hypothetical protein N0V90_004671 [Kalmusia sp. IMI 367209]
MQAGSTSTNYENTDYSGAKDFAPKLRCTGGTLGFQQFAMASLDFKLGNRDGKFHFQRIGGPYLRTISAAEKTPVLLYDTGDRRAWLVSAAEVLLHIAQHRHRLQPDMSPSKLDTAITDGSSAKDVLLKNEAIVLYGDEKYTFKSLIVDLWSVLEHLIDQDVALSQNPHGPAINGSFNETLQGYEYMAIVEECSPITKKQVQLRKTHGGWAPLNMQILVFANSGKGVQKNVTISAQEQAPWCDCGLSLAVASLANTSRPAATFDGTMVAQYYLNLAHTPRTVTVTVFNRWWPSRFLRTWIHPER